MLPKLRGGGLGAFGCRKQDPVSVRERCGRCGGRFSRAVVVKSSLRLELHIDTAPVVYVYEWLLRKRIACGVGSSSY